MSEVIPRWGMPEVNFVESDPERVLRSLIAGYEKVTGRTLQPGHPGLQRETCPILISNSLSITVNNLCIPLPNY